MNKKLSNDENIKNLKRRVNLRIIIIVLLLITLVLAIASIFYNFLIIPTLILYIFTRILTKYREKIQINKK